VYWHWFCDKVEGLPANKFEEHVTCGSFQLGELSVRCPDQVKQDKNVDPVIMVSTHATTGVSLDTRILFNIEKTTFVNILTDFSHLAARLRAP
jgi:hypothetical protein